MKGKLTSKSKVGSLRPTVAGAGLVALDVVVNASTQEEPQVFRRWHVWERTHHSEFSRLGL